MTENLPEITARVFVRHPKTNRTLFIRRAKGFAAGRWEPPGGKKNIGEEDHIPIDVDTAWTAARELKEETRIAAFPSELSYLIGHSRVNRRGNNKLTDYFVLEVGSRAVKLAEESHDMKKWVSRPKGIPYLGHDPLAGEEFDLGLPVYDWLDKYAGKLSIISDHEGLMRPLAYYTVFNWPLQPEIAKPGQELQTCGVS